MAQTSINRKPLFITSFSYDLIVVVVVVVVVVVEVVIIVVVVVVAPFYLNLSY